MKRIWIIVMLLALALSFCACDQRDDKKHPITSDTDGIHVNYSEKVIDVFDSCTLKLVGTEEKAVWKSANSEIATVDQNGKVTGVAAGNTTVTATVNGKEYSCRISVANSGEIPVIRMDLALGEIELNEGSRYLLAPQLIYRDENCRDVHYAFSDYDTSVILVSESGEITAVSVGETSVMIHAEWRPGVEIADIVIPVIVN